MKENDEESLKMDKIDGIQGDSENSVILSECFREAILRRGNRRGAGARSTGRRITAQTQKSLPAVNKSRPFNDQRDRYEKIHQFNDRMFAGDGRSRARAAAGRTDITETERGH